MKRMLLATLIAVAMGSGSGCCLLDRLFCCPKCYPIPAGCGPCMQQGGCDGCSPCSDGCPPCTQGGGGPCMGGGCSSGYGGPNGGPGIGPWAGGGCAPGDGGCAGGGCAGGGASYNCEADGSKYNLTNYDGYCDGSTCTGPGYVGKSPSKCFSRRPAAPGGPPGMWPWGQQRYASPQCGQVAYPYYTTRGPRDFLNPNPPSIGP
ncbi:MAG TPA: hypothetical protein VHZ24_14625 [Pirellulales bacterium]|jgi:hypothetical protein|nr:hypothetical protein [Pirellulales bacterium]